MNAAEQKHAAAVAALAYVQDGMTVGLGSGSTSEIFVRELGKKVVEGLRVIGIPTSENTAIVARESGISLSEVDKVDRLHVTVDGADEVDGRFRLIKGGGGCLLREKIIANASDLMVVIIDETKLVGTLGEFPLPVEIDTFAFTVTAQKVFDALQNAGIQRPDVQLRRAGDSGKPFITDGGNYILDCACRSIPDPNAAASGLERVPGVVEHGLFIGLARVVIVGEDSGARIMEL